jgi:hypothetical protein
MLTLGLQRLFTLVALIILFLTWQAEFTVTAQEKDATQARIEALEKGIRDNPGVFNWNVHNELRHLYCCVKNPPDPRKAMEHTDVILQHSVMDEYHLNILSGWQIGKDSSTARANLLANAQAFPDLRFVAAACFLKIGDLYKAEGNQQEANSYYQKVATDNSPDMAQYRSQAEKDITIIEGGPDILYETGVGKGEFQGWSLPSNWKHLNGMLVSDGTGPGASGSIVPAYAPYVPTTADYAVEAEVQIIQNTSSGALGLIVRATIDNKEGYAGYVGRSYNAWVASNICVLSDSCKAPGQVYSPNADWHTYRVEAKGNIINLLVDNSLITTLPDNRYLNAGRVGFFTLAGEQVQMRNFKVLKLQ